MKMGLAERLHSFMGYDEEEEFEKEIVQQAPEARVFSLRDDDNSAVLMKLGRMDEAGAAADHLAAGRMVVLNMEESTRESACRLVDFLSGVAYAKNGRMERIAAHAYLLRSRRRKAASSAGNRNIQNRSPVERWFRRACFWLAFLATSKSGAPGPAFSIISFCAA